MTVVMAVEVDGPRVQELSPHLPGHRVMPMTPGACGRQGSSSIRRGWVRLVLIVASMAASNGLPGKVHLVRLGKLRSGDVRCYSKDGLKGSGFTLGVGFRF